MAARIPVSWILLLILLAVFAFFGYQILQASQETTTEKFPPYSPRDQELQQHALLAPQAAEHEDVPAHMGDDDDAVTAAPVSHKQPPIPKPMPRVPAQTEEDLRAPEPLQATPPAVQYDSPEATDPMNKTAFMSAEFGSNFRHPEQMIESRPGMTMGGDISSGVASEHSGPGGNRAVGYASEMAQNGGDFMQGISAFDGSVAGVAYSML